MNGDENKQSVEELQGEAKILAALEKIQQQLTYLEKKIEIVIQNQSAGKTPERFIPHPNRNEERFGDRGPQKFGKKPYGKPFRSFDKPHFGGKKFEGGPDSEARESHHKGEKRNFGHRKTFFGHRKGKH